MCQHVKYSSNYISWHNLGAHAGTNVAAARQSDRRHLTGTYELISARSTFFPLPSKGQRGDSDVSIFWFITFSWSYCLFIPSNTPATFIQSYLWSLTGKLLVFSLWVGSEDLWRSLRDDFVRLCSYLRVSNEGSVCVTVKQLVWVFKMNFLSYFWLNTL